MKRSIRFFLLLLPAALLLSLFTACGTPKDTAPAEKPSGSQSSKRDKDDKPGKDPDAGTGESVVTLVHLPFFAPWDCADPGAMTGSEYLSQFEDSVNLVYSVGSGADAETVLTMEMLLPDEYEQLEGVSYEALSVYAGGKVLAWSPEEPMISNRVYRITALISPTEGTFPSDCTADLLDFMYHPEGTAPELALFELTDDGSLKLSFCYDWAYAPVVLDNLRLSCDRPNYGTVVDSLPVGASYYTYAPELAEAPAVITSLSWYDSKGNVMTGTMDDGERSMVVTVAAPFGTVFSAVPAVAFDVNPVILQVYADGTAVEAAQPALETAMEIVSVEAESLTVRVTFGAEHEMMYIDPHSAGCMEDGNDACWQCAVCCRYYADASALQEISYGSTIRNALGHDYQLDETLSTGASCAHPAVAYWQCSRCSAFVSEVTAPALGHDAVYECMDPRVHIARCSRCGADLGVSDHTDRGSCALCDYMVVN